MTTPQSLATTLDLAVDAQWGEPFVMTPYKVARQMADPAVDNSRSVVNGVGYVVGRFSGLQKAAGDFLTKRAEADMLLSVRDQYLGTVRKGDRITLTQRSQTLEVSYLEPGSVNGRTVIHLLRLPSNA